MLRIAIAIALCTAVACGGDDDDDDDVVSIDAAPPIDAVVSVDACGSGEICGRSCTGSSIGLDCTAFCAPIEPLECASLMRQEVCLNLCSEMKSECEPEFSHFIDCAGAVPEWSCVGPTMLVASGGCTVALDCPCLRPILESCFGEIVGDTAPGANELDYNPTVADCIDITASPPDPDLCAASAAPAALTVDLDTEVGGNDGSAAAFLAFELDDSFTADQVTGVTLQLATGGLGAEGTMSGEVWEVEAFTRSSLATTAPAKVGSAPVSDDLGIVTTCTVYEWPLTVNVTPSSTVYLGVFPTSPNGVDYFSLGGDFEPRLRIELTP